MKIIFNYCIFCYTLETDTGWYFGKTAGLLGTLDNEPINDMLSSNGYLEPDLFKFTESWSLNENTCSTYTSVLRKAAPSPQIVELCDSYFKHKTSPLFTCFSVVSIIYIYRYSSSYIRYRILYTRRKLIHYKRK